MADTYDVLADIVRRIESAEKDVATLKADIKEIYAEAKEADYDTKTLRKLIMKRRKDPAELRAIEEKIEELESQLELAPTNRARDAAD